MIDFYPSLIFLLVDNILMVVCRNVFAMLSSIIQFNLASKIRILYQKHKIGLAFRSN